MGRKFLSFCLWGARRCAAGVLTLAVWTLWLCLAVLAAVQVYVASTNELSVPFFVQSALEERLAISGIRMTFGRTLFDPSGRILIEDVRFTLAGFEEPVMTARAIYGRLDLLALALRRVEPRELRVSGVSLRVPAMLSPSGRADEFVGDLDAGFRMRADLLTVDYLSCRLGGVPVSAFGSIALAGAAAPGQKPLPIAEFLSRNYASLSHECAVAIEGIGHMDRPVLRARLEPSRSGAGAVARVLLLADALKLAGGQDIRARGVRVETRLPLGEAGPSSAEVSLDAERIEAPGILGTAVTGLRALVDVGIDARKSGGPEIAVRQVRFSCRDASAGGVEVRDLYGSAVLTGAVFSTGGGRARPDRLDATLCGLLWSEPVSVGARLGLPDGRADLDFRGALGPGALEAVGARLKRDLARFVTITRPVALEGQAHFGPAWKFSGAAGHVNAAGLTARGVMLDEARGNLAFDGRRLVATDAYARIGDDFARGNYEQDVPGLHYRFLIAGRLRPLDITPWIAGKWWNQVFGELAFPAVPPSADMDLSGCWTDGRQARVFISVDSAGPVYRGQAFDHVSTRLFIRPQFDDCLQFSASRGVQSASGTFARSYDFDAGAFKGLDFDVASTLDLGVLEAVLGPASSQLAVFSCERPPTIQARGHVDGPAAAGGPHQELQIRARSDGGIRYHDFPLESLEFTAGVHDGDIVIDPISAGFAGGVVSGKAGIWGAGAARRLKVDASVRDASLGRAIETVDLFSARRNHRPPSASGNLVKEKANVRIDVAGSAEGLFADPYSFKGAGTAQVQGAELGEVRMLGLLSELFRFTSLRFTTGRASFTLEGSRIVFPDISITGANSGITAHGSYAIDRHELDFRARISPFQESRLFPQKFMDVMLSPLSGVLEVRLAGTIEKPSWSFANGPSNLFRSLSPEEAAGDKAPPPSYLLKGRP